MRISGQRSAALAVAATAVFGLAQIGSAHADPDSDMSTAALLPTQTKLDEPAVARYGNPVTLKGRVSSPTSGLGLGATHVQLTFDPVKGVTKTLTVSTDGAGNFVTHFTPKVRTVVRAVTPANLLHAASSARTVMKVEAPVTCTIGAVRFADGAREVPGRCVIKGLPAGTRYLVQTRDGGIWRNVIAARTQKGRLSFVLALPNRTTSFRVFVLPVKKWVPTPSRTFTLYV
jgi:hypothetical protein